MMLLVYIFVIFVANIGYGLEMAKDESNFGPYDIRWTRYSICSGSKPRNASKITLTLEKQNDDYYANLEYDVLVPTSINVIKVWVYKVKNEMKSLLWVYKSSDACNHFIFADIIKTQFKTTNCVIEKGSRNITVNFTEITKNMIGSSFFYGNYSMKAIATSKTANFMCLVLNVEFYKKNM